MSEPAPTHEPLSQQFESARQEFHDVILHNTVLRAVSLPQYNEVPPDVSTQPYFRAHDYGILVTSPEETSYGQRTGSAIEQFNHRFVPILHVVRRNQEVQNLYQHPHFLEIAQGLGFSTEEIENSTRTFEQAAFRIQHELPPGTVTLNRSLFVWQLATRRFFG